MHVLLIEIHLAGPKLQMQIWHFGWNEKHFPLWIIQLNLFFFFFCLLLLLREDVDTSDAPISQRCEAAAEVQLLNLEDLFIISVLIERIVAGELQVYWWLPHFILEESVAAVFTGSTAPERFIEPSRCPCFAAFCFFPAVTTQNARGAICSRTW